MYMQYPYNVNSPQRTEVVRVTGENGARAYQLLPNSSALLLDETAPIVWLVQADGAGYKTLTPYKIEPYHPEPIPDIKDLMERITRLEDKINDQSYITEPEQRSRSTGKQPSQQTHEREESKRNVRAADAE